MPYTRRQVRFLESSGSPLSGKQKDKMNRELHNDPSLGHREKGHMSKVDKYKESKKKAHRISIERVKDHKGGDAFKVTTHYPGPIDGSDHGTLIDDERDVIHTKLSSIHKHINEKMGGITKKDEMSEGIK
jgi:hypothetical protein